MVDRRIEELRQAKALLRYQIISAYLAEDPPWGKRIAYLEHLASKTWSGIDGEPFVAKAETLRKWVRQYRRYGVEGLMDAARMKKGSFALSEEQVTFACQLKREVPERSLETVIEIMEVAKMANPGQIRRSTLHRHLQAAGLSKAPAKKSDNKDLGRFEADYPNALWQSDLLVGPWLPDPKKPGKSHRAYLYAFLDDHSRYLLHGRFSFKGDLPALELVFRRAVQKCGVPTRVYYDNAQVYRSHQMRQVVAELGVHGIIYTQAYRPMGHGKIEALNRYIRRNFLAELKASKIKTLDALNEAFLAWSDRYNRRVHGQTGQTPLERWRVEPERLRFAEEEALRQAFLWREKRRVDKTALLRLFTIQYQVDTKLAGRSVEVRYDPERLEEIEVWWKGEFVHRATPFKVRAGRRPKTTQEAFDGAREGESTPTIDWLEHLVQERRKKGFLEPTPQQLKQHLTSERRNANLAVIDLLHEKLDPAILDDMEIGGFLERYGPFDIERCAWAIDRVIQRDGRTDHHINVYLEAIRQANRGEPS